VRVKLKRPLSRVPAALQDPELELLAREEARIVSAAVGSLPAREQEIVTHHNGLGDPPQSIAEIAAELHLSERRTRTIERARAAGDGRSRRLRLSRSELRIDPDAP
jgi:DNA-directed RNA polymerase specialized sigma24 family protein